MSKSDESSSNPNRRDVLKYGITGVVAAALGGIAGWSIGTTAPGPGPGVATTTVTKGGAEKRPEVVKIGLLVEESGPLAGLGSEMKAGTLLAQKQINNWGGILGIPVEVVVCDTGSTVEGAVSGAEKLISSDRVDFLFGPFDSGGAYAVADIVAKYGILWINAVGVGGEFTDKVSKDIEKYKYVWATNYEGWGVHGVYTGIIDDMVDTGVWKPKARKLALITESSDWPAIGRGLWKEWAQRKGWEVVVDEVVDFGATEFTSIIAKAKEAGATVLHWEVASWAQINKQIYESGIEAWNVMGYSSWASELPAISKTTGALALGMCEGHPSWFKTLVKEELGYDSSLSYCPHCYAAMMLLRDIIHKVDSFDKDKIRQALETVGISWQLEGVRGWWRFNEYHNTWVTFQHPESITKDQPMGLGLRAIGVQMIDGKWVTVWPAPLRQGDYVLPDWAK